MQPLLLLKQTLEAGYDPGPLRLDGPNVEFTAAEQLFSKLGPSKSARRTELGIGLEVGNRSLISRFRRVRPRSRQTTIELVEMTTRVGDEISTLSPKMKEKEILDQLPSQTSRWYQSFLTPSGENGFGFRIFRNRSFLEVGLDEEDVFEAALVPSVSLSGVFDPVIRSIIHIPGLRGNPERLYPVTAVGDSFPGQFQTYVASIIARWENDGDERRINALGDDLKALGLTWRVRAVPVSDTQVEIQVGRLPTAGQGGAWDLVNIADVGFGVSQWLPVLVALHAARAGQTIYIEQPEIHLHPRAQFNMGAILARAVRRGVRLVIETHSDLLVLGIQTLVARDELEPDQVMLHWFARRADGVTEITTAEVDETGSFGEWPEDFGDVNLRAQDQYLEAAEDKLAANPDLAEDAVGADEG